ncbi:hypothetical protein KBC86_00415 [Candidatus Gracilibacteria bacterium]|nr:hypothetical protein [Candidatus Gracilibacteria bacterium]
MKILSLLILIFIFGSCTRGEHADLPSERIVTFTSGESHIGYGVRLNGGDIMTATHVLADCKRWDCTFSGITLSGILIVSSADRSIIGNEKLDSTFLKQDIIQGDPVYILRFLSGGLKRYDTTVTNPNVSYIGIGNAYSGEILSKGIEIGISFEKGESGLPVWNSSGELIGVVSATNQASGKSYIVQ